MTNRASRIEVRSPVTTRQRLNHTASDHRSLPSAPQTISSSTELWRGGAPQGFPQLLPHGPQRRVPEEVAHPQLAVCLSTQSHIPGRVLTLSSTLVDSESTDGYHEWIRKGSIEQKLIDVAPNKDGNVATTVESICEALLFVMDSSNHPLYIHCNQGKHRTGCVVACLRKVQRVPMDEILAEYRVYSGIKARDGDIAFIKSFDPELVFEYAKTRGYLGGSSPVLKRLDSTISDIDTLAAALAAGAMADDTEDDMRWFTSAMSPASSSISDGPLEMRLTQPAILGGEDDEEVHFHPSNDKNMHGTIDQSPVVETVDVTMMGDDVESDASSDTEVYDGMVVDEAEAPPRRTTCIDPALVTMI